MVTSAWDSMKNIFLSYILAAILLTPAIAYGAVVGVHDEGTSHHKTACIEHCIQVAEEVEEMRTAVEMGELSIEVPVSSLERVFIEGNHELIELIDLPPPEHIQILTIQKLE